MKVRPGLARAIRSQCFGGSTLSRLTLVYQPQGGQRGLVRRLRSSSGATIAFPGRLSRHIGQDPQRGGRLLLRGGDPRTGTNFWKPLPELLAAAGVEPDGIVVHERLYDPPERLAWFGPLPAAV